MDYDFITLFATPTEHEFIFFWTEIFCLDKGIENQTKRSMQSEAGLE